MVKDCIEEARRHSSMKNKEVTMKILKYKLMSKAHQEWRGDLLEYIDRHELMLTHTECGGNSSFSELSKAVRRKLDLFDSEDDDHNEDA
ncbi:hypothetical protein KIN20_032308 [Parelaphostrongylus tenuis]|uniref:Uncharacterized protein n=1 Tax=Parelaphostrongylus tenuis TaxID=148309 RepID=A0AAD5R6T4_PARTN|nr:hypothetical protein KIN20_032308 [Parelaphostrongylus tenuis]